MGITAENEGAYEEDFKTPEGEESEADTGTEELPESLVAGTMTGTVDTTDVGAGEGALLDANTNTDFGVGAPSEELLKVEDPAATKDADEVSDDADASDEAAAGDAKFDPAEHTVPEVQKYLDSADAAERKRVLKEENKREPNDRAGILTYEPTSD